MNSKYRAKQGKTNNASLIVFSRNYPLSRLSPERCDNYCRPGRQFPENAYYNCLSP